MGIEWGSGGIPFRQTYPKHVTPIYHEGKNTLPANNASGKIPIDLLI